jgi:hypothetical protein
LQYYDEFKHITSFSSSNKDSKDSQTQSDSFYSYQQMADANYKHCLLSHANATDNTCSIDFTNNRPNEIFFELSKLFYLAAKEYFFENKNENKTENKNETESKISEENENVKLRVFAWASIHSNGSNHNMHHHQGSSLSFYYYFLLLLSGEDWTYFLS